MVAIAGRHSLCGECLMFQTPYCRWAQAGHDIIITTDNACPAFYPLAARWARFLKDRGKLRARIQALKEAEPSG